MTTHRIESVISLLIPARAVGSVTAPIDLRKFWNDATDTSVATNRNRATAVIQVMQNLSGNKGQGCQGVDARIGGAAADGGGGLRGKRRYLIRRKITTVSLIPVPRKRAEEAANRNRTHETPPR